MKVAPLLFAIVAVAFPSASEAACKTASIAGNWQLLSGNNDGLDQCTMTIASGGAVTGTCLSTTTLTGTLAQSSACLVYGKINGATFRGRSEALETTSALKPNLFTGLVSLPGNPTMVTGYRK